MWSDAQEDGPACPGAGLAVDPAPLLPVGAAAAGFPGGRAKCSVCDAFVSPIDGRLRRHDRFRGSDDHAEAQARAEWFNAFGWE